MIWMSPMLGHRYCNFFVCTGHCELLLALADFIQTFTFHDIKMMATERVSLKLAVMTY